MVTARERHFLEEKAEAEEGRADGRTRAEEPPRRLRAGRGRPPGGGARTGADRHPSAEPPAARPGRSRNQKFERPRSLPGEPGGGRRRGAALAAVAAACAGGGSPPRRR